MQSLIQTTSEIIILNLNVIVHESKQKQLTHLIVENKIIYPWRSGPNESADIIIAK